MKPTTSPCLTSNETSLRAQIVSDGWEPCAPPWPLERKIDRQSLGNLIAQRVVTLLCEADLIALGEISRLEWQCCSFLMLGAERKALSVQTPLEFCYLPAQMI